MERNARKKFFSNPDNLAKYFFETDLVYCKCAHVVKEGLTRGEAGVWRRGAV
jgi:hypothetical protein